MHSKDSCTEVGVPGIGFCLVQPAFDTQQHYSSSLSLHSSAAYVPMFICRNGWLWSWESGGGGRGGGLP